MLHNVAAMGRCGCLRETVSRAAHLLRHRRLLARGSLQGHTRHCAGREARGRAKQCALANLHALRLA